jgi:hypothetical protein
MPPAFSSASSEISTLKMSSHVMVGALMANSPSVPAASRSPNFADGSVNFLAV